MKMDSMFVLLLTMPLRPDGRVCAARTSERMLQRTNKDQRADVVSLSNCGEVFNAPAKVMSWCW